MKKILILVLAVALALGALTSCEDILSKIPGLGGEKPHSCESWCMDCGKCTDMECEEEICAEKCECIKPGNDWAENYDIITIAEALEIATAAGQNGTEDRYYIAGTVVTVSNASYGEMAVKDETGEIYVYGTYSADGELRFSDLEERPVAGDKVLLHCILSTFNDAPQVKNARLVDFEHVEVVIDPAEYPAATIAQARAAKTGDKVRVSGVVARITYANGKVPSGVILVDGKDSIYVYDNDIAGQVSIGNRIEVAASKTYWVLESEKNNADKFGYKGCNQLENAVLVSNDKGNNTWINDSIPETTVKDLLETPVTEDITTQVYKVNALVKKVVGTGYTNYYFYDIDGETGAYTYTQCNGSDFTWLDKFDGKICTVYLTALNAKSESSSCFFRLLPLEVIDEGYTFNTDDAAKYAVEYYGVGQFLPQYTGNPALELVTSVSSELLGFEGVTLSYTSDNESVVYFTTVDGKTVFNCGENGIANVTITATHGANTYSETVEITVGENEEFDTVTTKEAMNMEIGEEVFIRGIVGPSAANQPAFYIFDETGMIAVRMASDDDFSTFAIGNEVVIKGTRDMWTKNGTYGQICVSNAVVVANYYGNHEYNTDFFIKDKNFEYVYNLDENDNTEACNVYVLKGTVQFIGSGYSTQVKFTDGTTTLTVYCSGSGQYNWLKDYVGQEVTVELAPCNWNTKAYYATCILSITTADGTKVYNTLNFDSAK